MTTDTINRSITDFAAVGATVAPRQTAQSITANITSRPMTLVADGWDDDAEPQDPFELPGEDAFDPADSGGFGNEFVEAPELERVARALITAHPARLGHLAPFRIAYRWKRSGGGGSKPTLGECKRLSGIARHALQAHFLVWLAADHLDGLYPTNWHIEALLFHQLCHITFDPKTAKPIIRDHDWTGFDAELRVYGPWHEDLVRAGESFLQVPMFAEGSWSPLGGFVPLMGAVA